MTEQLIKKQEFRWSYMKKGSQVLNICTRLLFLFGFAAALMGGSTLAKANPTDGNVVGGSATINNTATELQIRQSSQNALIEWGSFNIAAGETTHFYQPNASATALNRVVNATQLSTINGNLIANGHVIVINPNGVLIGKGAHVDTAGFIASSADISNSAFMNGNGKLNFDIAGRADASVVNEGTITVADTGLAALVAPTVRNDGIIQGNLSRIHLGAGDTFAVDLYGDGLLSLAVAHSGPRKLSVENNGSLIASGGKVLMTAAAASDVVTSVINNTGVVRANGLVNHNGEIVLTGAGADVKVAGVLDVSGVNGGTIKVGGDFQGSGTLAHAANTLITADAVLDASAAADTGLGGLVVVWADKVTQFFGTALAKAGLAGGDGGLVETSAHETLIAEGAVDASAPNGAAGTWLLDPQSIRIYTTTNQISQSGNSFSGGSGNGTSVLNVTTLQNALSSGSGTNVTVKTNGSGSGTGDITVDAALSLNSGSHNAVLTLDAVGDVIVNQAISVSGNNHLGLAVTAGNDIDVNAAVNTNGNDVSLNANGGHVNSTAAGTITTSGGDVTVTASGSVGLAGAVNAGSGSIGVTASKSPSNAVGNVSVAALTTTGNGAINVFTDNGDVALTGAVTSASGSVTVKSTGGTSQVSSAAGGTVSTTGGSVTVTSAKDVNLAGNIGVTGNGSITVTGSTGTSPGGVTVAKLTSVSGGIGVSTNDGSVTANGDITSSNGAISLSSGNGGSITTKNLTVNSGLGGVSSLTVDSAGALTVNGAVSVANDDDQAQADHSEADVSLSAVNDLTVTGGITVSSKDHDQPHIGATTSLSVTSTNGGVNVGGAITATSDAYKNTSGGDGPTADTSVTVAAKNDIVIGGAVSGTATAVKTGSGSDYSTSTVSIKSTNGGLWLAGAAPKAGTDAATEQHAYDGSAYDHTTKGDSNTDVARLILSGKQYTLNVNANSGQGKVYNGQSGSDPALTYTSTGTLLHGDAFSGVLQRASGNNVGSYAIGQGTLTAGANYKIVYTGATFVITAAPLTLSAVTDQRDYNGTTSSSKTVLVSGLQSGDTVNATQTFDSANAGTRTLTVSSYAITDGNGGHNYALTLNTASGKIDPAKLTVTANNGQGKVYNGQSGSDPVLTYSVTGTLYGSDKLSGSLTRDAGNNVGSYAIKQGGVTAGSNYSITYVGNNFVITAAPLTVTANSGQGKTYNGLSGSDPALTYSVTGTVYGGDSLTGALTRDAGNNVGSYAIKQGNLSAGNNYSITYVGSNFVITPASLTLTAVTDTKVYDGTTDSSRKVTISGVQAGDIVTASESFASKNVLGTNGSTLNVNGGYTVKNGSKDTSGNYIVNLVSALGTITPAKLTISAVTDLKVYDATVSSDDTPVVSGLKRGDTVTSLAQEFTSKDVKGLFGSTLQVTGYKVNDGNNGNNYTVTTKTFFGTITPAALLLAANTDTKVYDGTTSSSATPTIHGLKGEDSVTGATEAFVSKNVYGKNGSILYVNGYTVNDGNNGHNYLVVSTPAFGTITPAALTLSAVEDEKTYDGTTDSDGVVEVSGIKKGDSVTTSQSYDSKNVLGEGESTLHVNGYVIKDGNNGHNYLVTKETASGTINPADLVINASYDEKTYDGTTDSSAGPTADGLFGEDSITASQHFDSKNAGERTLTVDEGYTVNDGNGGNNYHVVEVNSSEGFIDRASLYLYASSDEKTYDGTTNSKGEVGYEGLVEGDSISGLTQSFSSKNAGFRSLYVNGGYAIVDGEGENMLGNYNVYTGKGAEGYINKATLVITADHKSKLVGQTDPALTYTETGLVAGDEYLINLTRDAGETVGNYAIKLVASNSATDLPPPKIITPCLDDGPACGGDFVQPFVFFSEGPSINDNYNVTYNGNFLTINATGDQSRVTFDSLGRPVLSVADKVIDFNPSFEPREVGSNVKISLRGNGNNGGNGANGFANLEPAAGGDDDKKGKKHHHGQHVANNSSPQDLASLEPAAGGNGGQKPQGNGGSFMADANAFLDGEGPAQ